MVAPNPFLRELYFNADKHEAVLVSENPFDPALSDSLEAL